MSLPRPIDIRFALAPAAYQTPAHFDHFDIASTCRLTRFVDLGRAMPEPVDDEDVSAVAQPSNTFHTRPR